MSNSVLQFLDSQGIKYKQTTPPNIIIDKCFHCGKNDHCYMETHEDNSPQAARSGLYICHHCSVSGNIYSLKKHLGINDYQPKLLAASTEKLPDYLAAHEALLADSDALEYLETVRGFSREIIKQQKIGLIEKHYFKKAGNARAILFPYVVNDQQLWCHYRTLPDINDLTKIPKDFSSPIGFDAILYQGHILKDGLQEVVFVEGEANCIVALDKGIDYVVGVPGANMKSNTWLESLEKLPDLKIYILYDVDKVGQKAAQALAQRIGYEKCYKIILPKFEVPIDGTNLLKPGKDLNEWFVYGEGTKEKFEELKAAASLFDVNGTASTIDAIDEFQEQLEDSGAQAKYVYPLIASLVHFEEGDILDVIAEEKIGKTTFAMNLIDYMVETYGVNGGILCLEMTRARLARKYISMKAQVPDNLPQSIEEAKTLTDNFKSAIPLVKEMVKNCAGQLFWCYPTYKTEDDLYKIMIDMIRRYNLKWLMLDNLQRFADTTLVGTKNRTQHLSQISKTTSQIGKDYGTCLIRIIQPHSVAEGKLTTSKSADGASQISKDCDATLALNRVNLAAGMTKDDLVNGGFLQHSGASYSPEMHVAANISRYSAGESVTVWFNGATSTVFPLSEGKIAAMNQKANKGVGYIEQLKASNLPVTHLINKEVEDGDINI